MGTQARVEILRAVRDAPKVLLLDEPTAVLTPDETDAFFTTLRRLRDRGVLVVFITHKLAEALTVCDDITILRHGAVIATRAARDTSTDELAALMVGDDTARRGVGDAEARVGMRSIPARGGIPHSAPGNGVTHRVDASSPARLHDDATHRGRTPQPPIVLSVERLATPPSDARVALRDVAFAVEAGEICGVAGVDGNGQEELAGALCGTVEREGVVAVGGRTLRSGDVVGAQAAGVALIPPDRRRDGLALGLAVWENAILAQPLLARFSRAGVLARTAARTFAAALARAHRVGRGDPDQATAALSGGNQQRLVIGRALAVDPAVLIAVNPTRGLDITATAHVQALLRGAAAAGVAIVLISTDLDELAALCARAFVLYRGRLLGPVGAAERARIGALMGGVAA